MLFRIGLGAAAERTADFELNFLEILGRPWLGGGALSPFSSGFLRAVDDVAQDLLDRSEGAIRAMAGLLADTMGPREPPWWACFSQEIESILAAKDTAGLCSALGLGHRKDGEWLLVWRYPVAAAGPLYRPTVLEANDSPYHHPSPPQYPLGITMPLDAGQPACREVLHRPLRGVAAVQGCTGELVRLENFAARGDRRRLALLRLGHRERLRREFPTSGLNPWMERHPEPEL